ncbi:hypothetical protein ACP179_20660 [Xenorhabdus stockiae]|uniref:hypothetical protein n=1 Tax=Xenorhabdus stockiae TaxID=351614 RepID=UPI003CE69300
MSGIFISSQDWEKLTDRTREELLTLVTNGAREDVSYEEMGGATDLSSLQAANLVRGLGEKSRKVLKAILEVSDVQGRFWCKEAANELGVESESFRGVWSGLTRRLRSITGDDESYLFEWAWDDERDDYQGTFNEITHKNLKKALNL